MNLPKEPRSTYKALLLNYDDLLARSDEECCFSLSEREVQMTLGFVDYIAWKTRYQSTATEIDQETIDAWCANLARKLMSGCCPDDGLIFRFSETGIYQKSDDGGATWEDAPELDPRNDGVGAPALPGSGEGTKCAAADNAREQFKVMRDNLIALLTAGTTLLAIIAGLTGLIGIILGLSGAATGIGVLLIGMATELLSLTPEAVTDELTDAAMDDFRCILFCRMDDNGQLSYDAWQLVLSDIDGKFSGFPHTFFWSIATSMGYIGLSNAGTMGTSEADDCDDCDCSVCSGKFDALIISGSPYALDVVHGDGFIEFTAHDTFGYIAASIEAGCCKPILLEMISGNGNTSGFCSCGVEYPDLTHTNPITAEACCQVIEVIGEFQARYRIYFEAC